MCSGNCMNDNGDCCLGCNTCDCEEMIEDDDCIRYEDLQDSDDELVRKFE